MNRSTPSRPAVSRSRTSKNHVRANKNLGQHFLTDTAIITRIVHALRPHADERLIEIGPGLGALTLPILTAYQELMVIELDRRVIPILRDKASMIGELSIIEQDVLKVDFSQFISPLTPHLQVFGNLPYNISTPILFLLTEVASVREMLFMLQKEVVDRMVAQPNSKDYGRLSIMLQQQHDVEALFLVPPASFSPPPKVMSQMVSLTRRATPRWSVDCAETFVIVVKAAFAMRRKTLRNNLKTFLEPADWQALNLDSQQRAEQLDGEDFARIANYLNARTPQ